MPKKLIDREVYRPIKGSPGAFIGIVEAPEETSALKAFHRREAPDGHR